MIKRLELKNFRCYRELDLSLKQFNIVVGESGSGKTTLLESLFLIAGANPEIYLRVRNWRGFSRALNLTGSREQYKSIFSDLFYNFDDSNGAVLSYEDSTYGSRKLEVGYSDSVKFGLDLNDPRPHAFTISPIEFKYVINGRVHKSALTLDGGKLTIEGAAPVAPLAYYNAINTNSFETTSAFSTLSRNFRVVSLIESIGSIYPQVKDISLELIAGDPTLCATTYGLSQRIPLGDLSGGIAKFVTVALAILMNPHGTVIVDEFESSLYYRNITSVWNALVQLAIQEHVQLIVTTHSYEFLQAAAPVLAAEGIAKNSQLLRAELGEDGKHFIRPIPATALSAATSQDFEVR